MPRNPDRTDLCHFTYADGRRCTLPQSSNTFGLCHDHARKYHALLDAREADAVLRHVTRFLENPNRTPTELCAALAALFVVTAEGHVKPKTAARLTYRVQCLLQSPLSAGRSGQEVTRTEPNAVTQPQLPDKTPQPTRRLPQSTAQAHDNHL
jgi:hypothetical protein